MANETRKSYQGDAQIAPRGFLAMARMAIGLYGFPETVLRYLLLREKTRQFVRQGATKEDRQWRRAMLASFNRIQGAIPCSHSPYHLLLLADHILKLGVKGPLVECGCYKGGSTAKLSLLAKRTGRRLHVCDSFMGLPPPAAGEAQLEGHCFDIQVREGEFAGTLDEVKDNVSRYGCLDVCEFHPGFFQDSLPGLDIEPALVFIDVDLVSSARDCLAHLWPRLREGGLWFTHEASYPRYVEGMLSPDWWREALHEDPPIPWGAGQDNASLAIGLAYLRKGAHPDADTPAS